VGWAGGAAAAADLDSETDPLLGERRVGVGLAGVLVDRVSVADDGKSFNRADLFTEPFGPHPSRALPYLLTHFAEMSSIMCH
jgi:hypothetical protein